LKQFFLQWTTSSYVVCSSLQKLSESLSPQVKFGSDIGVNAGRASVSLIAGGHELENAAELAELVVASLTTTVVEAGWVIEDLMLVSKVKVAGVGGVAVIDWLEELLVVVEAAGAAVDVFLQVPNLLGRQFVHDFPAFTQAQPLHKPDLLHLHSTP